MIDIDSAISESKNKTNISDGGSACFDFGDVVLVKYSCIQKYLRPGEHTRDKSEEIMVAINKKASAGVNTPKHLGVKRVVEGNNEICYVLQEKCPGINCASKNKNNVSFEEMCTSLESILNIPFEHYQKMIVDGCMLYEMGYEAKNKNLFYDSKSGFWYIDFLDNDKEHPFDSNNPETLFEALKNRIPKPINLASTVAYDETLTASQTNKKNILENAIKAKTLLAIKSLYPSFTKYEKFFLANESSEYKQYLMQEGIVKTNLMSLNPEDYQVFNELYETIINGLINKITSKGEQFWSIETNDIRNDCGLFNLQKVWLMHNENPIKREDFSDNYNYEYESFQTLKEKIIIDLIHRLESLEPNDNINRFLTDAKEKMNISKKTK